jgi:hypothetical protein
MNASSQPSGNSTSFIVTSALYALLLVIMFWGEGRASAQHPVNPPASAMIAAAQPASMSYHRDSHQTSQPPLASAPAPASIHIQSSGVLVGMTGLMILMMRAGRSLRQERSSLARPFKRA